MRGDRRSSEMVFSCLDKLNNEARSYGLPEDTLGKTKRIQRDAGDFRGDDCHNKLRKTSAVDGENSSQTLSETY